MWEEDSTVKTKFIFIQPAGQLFGITYISKRKKRKGRANKENFMGAVGMWDFSPLSWQRYTRSTLFPHCMLSLAFFIWRWKKKQEKRWTIKSWDNSLYIWGIAHPWWGLLDKSAIVFIMKYKTCPFSNNNDPLHLGPPVEQQSMYRWSHVRVGCCRYTHTNGPLASLIYGCLLKQR